MERAEVLAALEDVQELVDDAHETHPKLLEWQVPLSVPVRVGDDMQRVLGSSA
jgi:hypothetical protein